jgi:hypothetical protein
MIAVAKTSQPVAKSFDKEIKWFSNWLRCFSHCNHFVCIVK